MLRWLRFAAVSAPVLLGGLAAAWVPSAFAANDWVQFATISPTTTLGANQICYSDGIDIACNRTATLTASGLLNAPAVLTGGLGVTGAAHVAGSFSTSGTTLLSGSTHTENLYVRGALYVSGSQTIEGVTFANGGVSATGGVTATYFSGDGGGLTGVTAASTDRVVSGTTSVVASRDRSVTIATAGTTRMLVGENGYIGIGAFTNAVTPTSEFHVSTTRLNGYEPHFMFQGGKASGQAATIAFRRASSTHQNLFNFETGTAVNPDGFIGTMANKTAAIYMAAYRGNAGDLFIGVDNASGFRVGNGGNILTGRPGAIISSSGVAFFGGNAEQPSTTLQVSGTIQIANSGESCDANRAGAIRYASGSFDFCDGVNGWRSLSQVAAAGGVDRIVSGTHGVFVSEGSGYTSLTNGNTVYGYLGQSASYLPNLQVGGLISATDLRLSGNLYVSGSQQIDGVMFANGGVSATGGVTATYFSGDGSRLTNLNTGGFDDDRIVSGTTSVIANTSGYTSLSTGGVETGYFDTAGRLVVPGISTTTNQASFTTIKTNYIGVGSDISTDRQIGVYASRTDASIYGIYGDVMPTTTANGTTYAIGNSFAVRPVVLSGVTNSGYARGATFSAMRRDTTDEGNLAQIAGMLASYGHYNGTATARVTTDTYGMYLAPYAQNGTLTNLYDLYISQPQTGGTVGRHFSIYQQGVNSINYLAARTAIGLVGAQTPSTTLQVAGSVRLGTEISATLNTCDADRAGAIRWHASNSQFQVCYGSGGWATLAAAATSGTDAVVDRIVSGTTSVIASQDRSVTISTANTQRMVVGENGRVGIGTDNPAYGLVLNQTGNSVVHVSGSTFGQFYATSGAVAASMQADASGMLRVGTLTNHRFSLVQNSVERLTMHTSGYVGVSNTTPQASLDVSGTLRVAGSSGVETCTSTNYGTFRRNPSTGKMEICRQ